MMYREFISGSSRPADRCGLTCFDNRQVSDLAPFRRDPTKCLQTQCEWGRLPLWGKRRDLFCDGPIEDNTPAKSSST